MNILQKIAHTLGTRLIALADMPDTSAAAQPAAPISTGRIFVKSSVIKSMAFTPTSHYNVGMLLIEYVKGDIYAYDDVERADYEALRDADSKGTHLNQVFKPQYKGRLID